MHHLHFVQPHSTRASLNIDWSCIFRGRPQRGSGSAAQSEFMGNGGLEPGDDEYGLQIVNIYSRATVVVWPRKDRLKYSRRQAENAAGTFGSEVRAVRRERSGDDVLVGDAPSDH